MRFTNPLALILLILLPAVAVLGWPARGAGRRREIASLALRLGIVLCLALALAGFSTVRTSRNLAVVFLIDVSDSMPKAAVAAAVDYTRQAIGHMGPDDQAAVIAFGSEALVDRPMSSTRAFEGISSIPVTSATDIAQAMRLGLALYPPGAARRMVILSDGADTTSGADATGGSQLLDTARLAAASNVEIVVLPFIASRGPEVSISRVDAPTRLKQGERFDMQLSLNASQPTKVSVRVLENGKVVYEGSYELRRGSQSFSLPLVAGEPGFDRYQVQVSSADDTYYQNNEAAAYTQVEGPPRVLVIAPPPGEPLDASGEKRPYEAAALVAALQAAGYMVETVQPSTLPSELTGLAQYSSVVLVDVPARELSQRQMQAVQSYVRDLGGGLVAVGGPTSFGVGGYFRTPLEETLPVEMQIKDQKRRPSLAMVFIIDHSGSMMETSGGATKLELAKEAAIRSVQLLFPTDRVGVIAFDESASWVVPMTDLGDPDTVIRAIGTIRGGGGTDILAGVQAMAKVLPGDPAQVKHVILLTDGGADPTGIPELVSKLNSENNITLSTVGVGRDAADFLPKLAELGGGRYHFTADPGSIPSIFTEETSLATRAYIVEESFFPKLVSSSPILAGIDRVPALQGYVGTSAKAAAQTILVSEKGDPVLAAWQYGLGKAIAFTSDATGRWAKDWVGWQGFASFWAQAVRYTASPGSSSPLEIRVEGSGDQTHLVVDAFGLNAGAPSEAQDPYLNGYAMQASIVSPDGKAVQVELQQVAPGQYAGDFQPSEPGAYLIHVTGGSPDGKDILSETAGWVESYSPEYRQLDSDPDALYRLAAAAGGKVAAQDPALIFAHTRPAPGSSRPAWPWLLTLAAMLLPVDIAVRRLALTRSDLRQGWLMFASLLRRENTISPAAEHAARLGALLQAKEKARPPQPERFERPAPALSRQGNIPPASPAEVSIEKEAPAAAEKTDEVKEEKTEKAAASTAAALLEQKRKRRSTRD